MRWWARWRRRKQWRERDLDREIRAHLDLEAEEQAAAGVPPGEASYAARRAFGNVDLFKEATREIWGWAWRDRLAQDIRYGLRRLRKSPGFTTVAVLSLALGVGANTAIFSIIHAVLLRPLPYPEPHRLLAIEETQSATKVFSSEAMMVSALHFVTWRKQCRSFEQIALLDGLSLNLTGMGEPERLDVERASATLFPLLGVQPRLGRSFLEEEDQPGRDRVVMLSDSLWHRRFQSDPGVVGRKITLDGVPFEVVGVLPASFRTPWLGGPVDLWKPFAIREDELQVIGDFNYECLARLRRGVSREQAVAEMKIIQSGIARTIPERVELGALLTPLAERMTAGSRQGLLLLLAAVGAVLLIACVNITNLLLARNTARRELAIRAAIGASRGRLGQQMLTESLILSALGGMAGVLLAQTVVGLVVAHAPADLPRIDEVRLDAPVFWFSFLISMVAGLVFGFLPAWKFSLADPQDALKADSRTTTGGTSSGRVRRLLVGCEVGLGTVCLVLAGLLMQSFVRLLRVERGYAVERILTVNLMMPAVRYPDLAARTKFLRSALDDLQRLPGVLAAGATNRQLLSGPGSNNSITLEGTKVPLLERPVVDYRCISPGYFRTFGIPLITGRVFDESDVHRNVAVLSAKTAQGLWPGENPVGKHFRLGDEGSPLAEVVGVAGDVRGVRLDEVPNPTVYLPYWQRDRRDMIIAVRTALEPAAMASGVRDTIRKLDPELPVRAFRTMEQVLIAELSPRRFQLTLVLLFAATALLLASIGIYGVVSYSVAQRRAEMGIRMALGATASDVKWLVMRQGMGPVVAGWAAGLVGALAVGRIVRSLLFDTGTSDLATLASVSAVVLLVALAACYLPSRRATRIDPMVALRYQ